MNIPKELQELRANTEELIKQYKEIKAIPLDNNSEHDNKIRDIEDMIFRMISYVHTRINSLENGFYDFSYTHLTNHLPNPATPSDMQTALNNLGLAKDFDVKKRTIYASVQYGFEELK